MENNNTIINQKDNKPIVRYFIIALISMIVLGGIIYYLLFGLLAGIALSGSSGASFYVFFIIAFLILIILFTFIIRKFKKACGQDRRGKGLFIFLIIFAILSPFIAGFTIRIVSDINSSILNQKVNKADQCDQDLYGSIVKVVDIKDSHKIGDPFILLELDVVAKKEAVLSLTGGVSYQTERFGTQLFRARWQRDVPWDEDFRFIDKGKTYYQTTIPKGESKLFITLDANNSYLSDSGFKNGLAVNGLQVDGPYKVNLQYRLLSEESTCLLNQLGYSGDGYNPSLSLISGGYQTQAYSWRDF